MNSILSAFLTASLIIASTAFCADVELAWDANTEPDIEGYRMFYGTESGVYGPPIEVVNKTSVIVPGLTNGATYYFAVTAYDTNHNESGYSNEVVHRIKEDLPDAPQNLNIVIKALNINITIEK